MPYEQPCFGGDGVQFQQILPQEKVQPFSALLRAVLRKDAQQIAVAENCGHILYRLLDVASESLEIEKDKLSNQSQIYKN